MRSRILVVVTAALACCALACPLSASAQESAVPAESVAPAETAAETAAETTSQTTVETDTPSDAEVARQLRVRAEIAEIHRGFGIATWASMLGTVVLGFIQFADEYGFHGNAGETACANGNAVFQEYCTGFPLPHAIAAFTTSALYFTTFGLSFAMPAPLGRSADVELHRTLRWAHLATMIATVLFGAITANIETDFQTRQALGLVHEGLAMTTFGLLTAAAAVVVF